MALTREFFDTLIIVVMILGSALAIVRLYQDLSRPVKRDRSTSSLEDTQPGLSKQDEA